MDKEKVLSMARELEELIQDERVFYSILVDPEMRYKLLVVLGAFRIRVPVLSKSPDGALESCTGPRLVREPFSL